MKTNSDNSILKILYVGRLEHRKGIYDLIEAINHTNLNCELTVLGGTANELETELDLSKVKFEGFQSDLRSYYLNADLLCVPSHHEGFGQVYLEAAAHGVIPVCCNIPGPTDFIKHNSNGFIVEAKSPDSILELFEEINLKKFDLDAIQKRAFESVQAYESSQVIIFNAPSDSYFVEQKIDGAWVHVNIEEKFDWLNVEYRVTATDQAGNSSQPLTTIINTASGTYKPTDPTFTQIIKGSTGNDYLYGGNGDDTLISNGDSDSLYGGSGNDTLIYGGNSPNIYTGLIGEAGNDTYIVDKALLGSLSYVHILDNTNEQNTLYLKSVSADEIILKQASADRIITFNDSTATIHFGEGQLSSIVFDDGTVWNKAQIEANIIGRLLGTDGDDHLQADANYSV